ncbi:DUF7004 family protein [Methanohalophilus sp.]
MMPDANRIIKKFADGTSLEFNNGQFDQWCVYLKTENEQLTNKWCVKSVNGYAPKDEYYFQSLKEYADKYSNNKVYSDFVNIYDSTNSSVEDTVLDLISNISKKYADDANEIEILYCILYTGMIAEENKARAVLGKRVKRLGMHQLLMDEPPLSAIEAANFSRGKKAFKTKDGSLSLDKECKNRGF